MVIEHGKLVMDNTKVEGITNWPTPKSVKEVHSFLGFRNFYCCFIRGYSDIAKGMNMLLCKDKSDCFIWMPEAEEAFQILKKHFTEKPILAMPD